MLSIVLKHTGLFFKKKEKSFSYLKKILGFKPGNIAVYKTALVHKSVKSYKINGEKTNNERLEFLGDAILGAVVAEILYDTYPFMDEGLLTKNRSKIVNREFLNRTAIQIGLHKILVSHVNKSIQNQNIYGDAFEALIGAIFIDKGYKRVKKFIQKKIFKKYVNLEYITAVETNYKSMLLEWGQKHKKEIDFTTEDKSPSPHEPLFETTILIDDSYSFNGEGNSKKEAQQNAAETAIMQLRKQNEFR